MCIRDRHGLSWMGGKSHPLTQSFQIPDPENADIDVSPGGIVLVEVADGSPLHAAELKAGDAVVRVAENWLPIKEDSTLDFIRLVEDQINAQNNEIEIGYIRSGQYSAAVLKTELQSLDENLPLANKRFIDSSTAMLNSVVELQQDDGSFVGTSDDPEHRLIVTSLCGLALLSVDESEKSRFTKPVSMVTGYLFEQLKEPEFTRELNPLTAAYVGSFLAEADLSENRDKWNEIVGVLSFSFISAQHDSGGWNVTELVAAEPDESNSDDSIAEDEADDVAAVSYTHLTLPTKA